MPSAHGRQAEGRQGPSEGRGLGRGVERRGQGTCSRRSKPPRRCAAARASAPLRGNSLRRGRGRRPGGSRCRSRWPSEHPLVIGWRALLRASPAASGVTVAPRHGRGWPALCAAPLDAGLRRSTWRALHGGIAPASRRVPRLPHPASLPGAALVQGEGRDQGRHRRDARRHSTEEKFKKERLRMAQHVWANSRQQLAQLPHCHQFTPEVLAEAEGLRAADAPAGAATAPATCIDCHKGVHVRAMIPPLARSPCSPRVA